MFRQVRHIRALGQQPGEQSIACQDDLCCLPGGTDGADTCVLWDHPDAGVAPEGPAAEQERWAADAEAAGCSGGGGGGGGSRRRRRGEPSPSGAAAGQRGAQDGHGARGGARRRRRRVVAREQQACVGSLDEPIESSRRPAGWPAAGGARVMRARGPLAPHVSAFQGAPALFGGLWSTESFSVLCFGEEG